MPRRSFLLVLGLLLTGLVTLPGRAKNPADPIPRADPVAIPNAVASDHFLFAHLNVKNLHASALFADLKRAFAKGGAGEWERIEEQFSKNFQLALKPTEIDGVTLCVPSEVGRPVDLWFVILTASKPIPKAGTFGLKPGAEPDARGFYSMGGEMRIHFPDDKTMVVLHSSLAQKYLDGYAKTRTGWPLTPELAKAAAGHAAFVALRVDILPAEARAEHRLREYAPLFAARTLTLTADVKGKELSVAARATFADATAAGKARHKVHAAVGLVSDEIDGLLAGKTDLGILRVPVKEAERALAAARIEVVGSDLIASASYTADFDVGVMMVEAIKRLREAAARLKAQNHLKQIALAMHNYANFNQDQIPIHGIGPKGAVLKKADEKPLLSWRVALLPYIEQQNLYAQFKLDEPWDSENNKKLIEKMPAMYASETRPGKPGYTHIQMVVGPKAMRLPHAVMPTSFPDGTSNTIALVEAAEPVIWTKPDDVMFPNKELPKEFRKKFGGQFPGGFHVALWDGSVRFVADTMSDKTLGFALCPNDGEVLGPDW